VVLLKNVSQRDAFLLVTFHFHDISGHQYLAVYFEAYAVTAIFTLKSIH